LTASRWYQRHFQLHRQNFLPLSFEAKRWMKRVLQACYDGILKCISMQLHASHGFGVTFAVKKPLCWSPWKARSVNRVSSRFGKFLASAKQAHHHQQH
jgi:hypothetical protein